MSRAGIRVTRQSSSAKRGVKVRRLLREIVAPASVATLGRGIRQRVQSNTVNVEHVGEVDGVLRALQAERHERPGVVHHHVEFAAAGRAGTITEPDRISSHDDRGRHRRVADNERESERHEETFLLLLDTHS